MGFVKSVTTGISWGPTLMPGRSALIVRHAMTPSHQNYVFAPRARRAKLKTLRGQVADAAVFLADQSCLSAGSVRTC